jgi:hypothetical protein
MRHRESRAAMCDDCDGDEALGGILADEPGLFSLTASLTLSLSLSLHRHPPLVFIHFF